MGDFTTEFTTIHSEGLITGSSSEGVERGLVRGVAKLEAEPFECILPPTSGEEMGVASVRGEGVRRGGGGTGRSKASKSSPKRGNSLGVQGGTTR